MSEKSVVVWAHNGTAVAPANNAAAISPIQPTRRCMNNPQQPDKRYGKTIPALHQVVTASELFVSERLAVQLALQQRELLLFLLLLNQNRRLHENQQNLLVL